MIVVCAALSREVAVLERRLAGRQRSTAGGYPVSRGVWGGKRVLLCRTGMGRRAQGALRALLAEHSPDLVLSAGVCGALNPSLRTGDLVLCRSVEIESSQRANAAPVAADETLLGRALAAAEAAALPVHTGRSLTVDRLVGRPPEKGALWRSTGLDVVEMESYWLALAARELGLPFLAARAVLDETADALPELPGAVGADGSLRTLSALSCVLRRPGRLPRLLSTALRERRALGTLTRFLGALVAALEATRVAEPA